MALESLKEQVEAVHQAEAELQAARLERDNLIRDARDAGVSMKALCSTTRLSRERIYRIGLMSKSSEAW
ncbi:hypothetical protein [Desertivibrio insolitus]|uniref:hypothetical protein n=1 Tax=Herbiconiux sp. SYSU D00978 TaxID=2812562 RepID=UPI001A966D06|nr:hypothetical protein [Herbiconiux sp. SYSU D00978]